MLCYEDIEMTEQNVVTGENADKGALKPQTFMSAKCKIAKVDHKVALTIKWEGISQAELQELAQRTIVHKAMSAYRTAG